MLLRGTLELHHLERKANFKRPGACLERGLGLLRREIGCQTDLFLAPNSKHMLLECSWPSTLKPPLCMLSLLYSPGLGSHLTGRQPRVNKSSQRTRCRGTETEKQTLHFLRTSGVCEGPGQELRGSGDVQSCVLSQESTCAGAVSRDFTAAKALSGSNKAPLHTTEPAALQPCQLPTRIHTNSAH